jgi:TetR/AcrR family transcriptional regulator, transcriptional repressor for nem operon
MKTPRINKSAEVAATTNQVEAAPTTLDLDTPYPEYLRAATRAPGLTKGQRTRGALLAAAAELLEKVGYHDLRVSDINEKAGVSNALFYTYFENKEAISHEVMTGFLTTLFAHEGTTPRPQTTEEAIYRSNLDYIRRFVANPGLMRVLIQFGDEAKEFGSLWRETNRAWLERVATRLSREPELKDMDPDTLWATVSSLGTMVDGMLRLVYIDADKATQTRTRGLTKDPITFAQFLTRLWVRGLYGRDTPARHRS